MNSTCHNSQVNDYLCQEYFNEYYFVCNNLVISKLFLERDTLDKVTFSFYEPFFKDILSEDSKGHTMEYFIELRSKEFFSHFDVLWIDMDTSCIPAIRLRDEMNDVICFSEQLHKAELMNIPSYIEMVSKYFENDDFYELYDGIISYSIEQGGFAYGDVEAETPMYDDFNLKYSIKNLLTLDNELKKIRFEFSYIRMNRSIFKNNEKIFNSKLNMQLIK